MSIQRRNLAGLAIVLAVLVVAATLVGLTSVQADANSPRKCTYNLSGSEGEARVTIIDESIHVKFADASPRILYTVWIDYRSRAGLAQIPPQSTEEAMADDYPIPFNEQFGVDLSNTGAGIDRGVAPAFAITQGVTSGMGLDANGIITNANGNGTLTVKLGYNLLQPGASPVVAADLVNQDDSGANRVGGGWLRLYQSPVTTASSQVIDPETGLPVVIRATAQGITIVKHPDNLTHGHTPGVKGTDHFSGFKGDFPVECLGS